MSRTRTGTQVTQRRILSPVRCGFPYQKIFPITSSKKIVPEISQKYRKISKDIEQRRKGNGPEKHVSTGEFVYFLRFLFDFGCLHTGEVTGSNSVSSTIARTKNKHACFSHPVLSKSRSPRPLKLEERAMHSFKEEIYEKESILIRHFL